MDMTFPAATFTGTREELLGAAPLLGTAEVARGIARHPDRTVSVFAMTPDRMRRIDGWLGAVGFVTHAAAPDMDQAAIGSVCDRDRASELLTEIVAALVGSLPVFAAPAALDLPALAVLAPGALPPGVGWIVVVTATSAGAAVERTVVADAGGLLIGADAALDRATRLAPAGRGALEAWLAAVVGRAPRSVSDLLDDD